MVLLDIPQDAITIPPAILVTSARALLTLAALLKREEQAREENDRASIAILNPGIILTQWQLKEEELQERM
jgi:hypothetical protein